VINLKGTLQEICRIGRNVVGGIRASTHTELSS
jgi:hypothetical protein